MEKNSNFYDEIYEKEKSWIEWINKNLINVYYLSNIESFYTQKLNELSEQYKKTNSEIVKSFMDSISHIQLEINRIKKEKDNDKIKDLPKLFLVNKINVDTKEKPVKTNDNDNLTSLKMKKDILKELREFYISEKEEVDDDYLYDDFPDNQKVA